MYGLVEMGGFVPTFPIDRNVPVRMPDTVLHRRPEGPMLRTDEP